MWGYYGSKGMVAKYYPVPKYDKIIEPFAGTAQYSLMYWEKDVILLDKYETIVNIWKWLQSCSEKDVLETRRLKYGENVDDFEWDCQERKDMVGFIIVGGPATPKKTASKWKTVTRPNTQNYKLNLISENLHKIRHWDIRVGDYKELENQEATWFIDPPYKVAGKYYKHNNNGIDFAELSNWSRQRSGQVIVCEGEGGDWLPFIDLVEARGSKKKYKEKIWTNT